MRCRRIAVCTQRCDECPERKVSDPTRSVSFLCNIHTHNAVVSPRSQMCAQVVTGVRALFNIFVRLSYAPSHSQDQRLHLLTVLFCLFVRECVAVFRLLNFLLCGVLPESGASIERYFMKYQIMPMQYLLFCGSFKSKRNR